MFPNISGAIFACAKIERPQFVEEFVIRHLLRCVLK